MVKVKPNVLLQTVKMKSTEDGDNLYWRRYWGIKVRFVARTMLFVQAICRIFKGYRCTLVACETAYALTFYALTFTG